MRFKYSTATRHQIRRQLLLDNPHCHECGRTLQGFDSERMDYASVFYEGYLLCQVCARVMNNRMRDNARRRRTERMAELSPRERQQAELVRRERMQPDQKARMLMRSKLMAECPLCWNCGKALQDADPHADGYANIVLQAGKLACCECVPLIVAMFKPEAVESSIA